MSDVLLIVILIISEIKLLLIMSISVVHPFDHRTNNQTGQKVGSELLLHAEERSAIGILWFPKRACA